MALIQWLRQPWPWYVAGPLIGLTVPLLLMMGNKNLGVSSSLRQICAACLPSKVPFFQYDWKKEAWQLYFVAGILAGGFIAGVLLQNPRMMQVNPRLMEEMRGYGMHVGFPDLELLPTSLFNWRTILNLNGFLLIAGGFLVGFGTRWAGGCTSGHSIMGLSNLQWPSLVATISFMAGGFFMANVVLPVILKHLTW
jgi:uncharacterized membrane protein YedE/YeeE